MLRIFQLMPICLFGADASRFEYGYIAGFGSTNFADVCWTSKSGPHPFEQCKHNFRGPDGTMHEVLCIVPTQSYDLFYEKHFSDLFD